MSSMFKKKGGLAFKPKIPSTRPRPAAPATTVQVTKNIEPESIPSTTTVEAPITDSQDQSHNGILSGDSTDDGDSSRVADAPQPIPVTPASTSHDGVNEQRQDQESIPGASPTATSTSDVDPNPADNVATIDKSSHEEPNVKEQRPKISYGLQNLTPPPTIADSLIAPELRDTPSTIQESHELAPLIQSTNSDQPQDITPIEAENTPTQLASQTPKPVAPRTRARRKATETASQDANGAEDAEARPRKRQRKTAQDADGTATTPKQPRKPKATTPSDPAKPRRARSVTPEDAEAQVVDLQKLKMTDLTKDLHIGKKFSRHDELRNRERQARLKAKLKKDGGDESRDASEAPDTPTTAATTAAAAADQATKSQSSTPADASTPTPAATAGPQFRIVDGQIIVDQSSLVMDRHARANANRGDMETVEENDFTRLITSNSFMNTSKLKGPNIWTDDETELFYRGLRMFGTEFEMISKMFPNKQRRHVKLKYNREERHCPERINAAVVGEKTTKIDIDEYKAFTGIEFESVESIEAEHRKIQEGFEAEQKRIVDEQAEIMRKKREELFADEEGEEGGKKKKKGKKRGKQTIAYGLNGEPIVTEA
ncbi:Transcription factor TFIIIB complex subunit bdp1 [Cladobotryum mycophilum]|uniref:Transcription factor TFIIIB complex subunit bdp1 n=1 Tax=Cladobotryum mycophilum TaxID=491253 RepID=A0ABR0SDG7_9HYPO